MGLSLSQKRLSVKGQSIPIQDEPEGLGMLRIEHQRAGSGEVESGGDTRSR
jgi:hypothetical protein